MVTIDDFSLELAKELEQLALTQYTELKPSPQFVSKLQITVNKTLEKYEAHLKQGFKEKIKTFLQETHDGL